MKTTCELNDYSDRSNAYENPKLIDQNNLVAHDEIYLIFKDVSVLVNANELKKAIDACSGWYSV